MGKIYILEDDKNISEIEQIALKNAGYEVVAINELDGTTLWAMKNCVDCRVTGTKNRPSFWPLSHQ